MASQSHHQTPQSINSQTLYYKSLTSLSLQVPPTPPPSLPLPPSLPPSKLIPKTRFLIDGFRFSSPSITAYFLSHFHSDHYTGLSSHWYQGIIFCSPITASLVTSILHVPECFVFSLPLNRAVDIDGVGVTLVDANHCPGAVQFLLKVPICKNLENFEQYVHTGDFRYSCEMKYDVFLRGFVGCNAVFLDTTYCHPKFVFPLQEESVDYVVSAIEKIGGEGFSVGIEKRVLFLVATYVVGKEKILIEIARRCNRKVFVDARKMEVLRILGYGESGLFTEDENESDVHVVGWNILGETWPYFRPNFVKMKEIMVERGYNKVVGFVPTGWTYEVKRNKFAVRSKDSCEIHLVPYSEHSNYNELREYVKFLRPKRVIPTVGVDVEKLDSKLAAKMQKHFAGLVDEMANKKEFLKGFLHGSSENDEKVEMDAVSGLNEGLAQEKELKESVEMKAMRIMTLFLMPNDEERDKLIHELSDCLPTWVTRDQMLDLISTPGRNIVEAVSSFYERETEFHDEVFAFSIDSDSRSMGFLSSQNYKSPSKNPKLKGGKSPGKRKRNVDNKPGKKEKIKSKLESGGSKQSTITKFFNKVLPDASQVSVVASISEQCPEDENLLQNDEETESYREEVDQFIQIIDGNESTRSYAAIIIKKTEGDINKALDMHYGDPKGNLGNRGFGGFWQYACWNGGQPAPYIHLARTFDLVEAEKGKIKATSLLCNMFRSLLALSPEDVLPAVYLCTNKIAAIMKMWLELNIGGTLVTSALEEACGTNRSKIREMYSSMGDLGDVAQVCRQTQTLLAPPPPLLIKDVFSALQKISLQTGSGSTGRKKSLIVNLMHSCREKEMKFIVRTLVRNLRIGAMMRTILPALAQAVVLNSFSSDECKAENVKEKLQYISTAVVEVYNILPALDLVVPSLINEGIGFSSSTLSMVAGIPLKPMLAKITNGVAQVLKLFENKAFTCEYKYDGQRAQIHKMPDGTVRIYSRNGDETSSRFPDLIKIIEESCKPAAVTLIVDAEVVAVDRKNGCKLKSFQELSSRERGSKDSSIAVNKIKVDICVFVFDIMFANGEQLLELPLRQRRQYLKDLFCDERLGCFEYAKEMTVEAQDATLTNDATLTKMKSFLEDALRSSCEGIMVKSLDIDAGYFPSKRTDGWLKVKKDYVEGLNDSLDLVPIGAWHGNGRKAGWFSPFLMACYNPETEEFQSVCRVMSGFSDAFYIEDLGQKPPYYRTVEAPDMWFSPEVVWEIRGADFTISPVHQAAVGLVHQSRGISIRFPRFIHSIPDRNPEECSTAADIAEMFNSQTRKMDVTAER
ncbi:DNA ligase [Salix suchowensis]|nr:DNA ligase [Salix suchowensis]